MWTIFNLSHKFLNKFNAKKLDIFYRSPVSDFRKVKTILKMIFSEIKYSRKTVAKPEHVIGNHTTPAQDVRTQDKKNRVTVTEPRMINTRTTKNRMTEPRTTKNRMTEPRKTKNRMTGPRMIKTRKTKKQEDKTQDNRTHSARAWIFWRKRNEPPKITNKLWDRTISGEKGRSQNPPVVKKGKSPGKATALG